MPTVDENFVKRIQPHSEEAERSVLGSMLMDRDAIVEAEDILTKEDFYQRQYGIVFEAMVELYREGKAVDLITLQNKLKEKNMTRYELAKKIGVTYPTIDKIYKGESTSIKFDILEAICKELNCSPLEILDTDDYQMKRLLTYATEINKASKNKDDTN